MTEHFQSQAHGHRPNYAHDGLMLRRAMDIACEGLYTAEPCIVDSYDFLTQRVSVRLKNFPKAPVIHNVPIYNTMGSLRVYRSFTTYQENPLNADVGILLFMRSDSTTSWDFHSAQPAVTHTCHKGLGPVFVPGPLPLEDTVPTKRPAVQDDSATSATLDKMGPKDTALVHDSGAFILFKEDGKLVIKADEVYIGDKADAVATYKAAARKGDAGDGMGGAIAGGSSNVFLG
jgi:hypothetical protein